MPTISLQELQDHDPEKILPVEEEFKESYQQYVDVGKSLATSVAFVAICRNAMPFLPFTLERIERLRGHFKESSVYVYENDSTDGTKDCLAQWDSVEDGRQAVLTTNGRPHLNCTKANERTIALAEYRNNCLEWVKAKAKVPGWVVVFDTDPWGGFSVDGVLNSIGHMATDCQDAVGMASYSWCQWGQPVWAAPTLCHYDAWACRPNYWTERKDMLWFHLWHPPVGSSPVRMNSAFGQLAVYRGRRFVSGRYSGEDCEHVPFHRSCGGPMYLNPSQRVVSFWCPENESTSGTDAPVRGDVHQAVAERDADQGNR